MTPDLLDSIVAAMPEGVADSAGRCAEALHTQLSGQEQRTVLIGYGGGKDSSYMVAFVRLTQLVYRRKFGTTFTIRAITNRQPGMAPEVLDNIARVYAALGMPGDPTCELLLRAAGVVGPFTADAAADPAMIRRYREDVLMAGHRSGGSGRPTFCNSCNFDMVGAFGAGADHGDGVDLIITGDSVREQRLYQIWVNRLADRVVTAGDRGSGFSGLQQTIAGLSDQYFRDLYGPDQAALAHRALPVTHPRVRFFSIYDYTEYASGRHWAFLVDFLGFRFDELAFNFTESDCANPLLMAHLRGLRVERMTDRDYADGIAEYLRFALNLMRHKDIPAALVDQMRDRYTGAANVARMREKAVQYSESTYQLTEQHLVCMVYSPFVDQCQGLDHYLCREQPELAGRAEEIKAVLLGTSQDVELAAAITTMSGLALAQARHLSQAPASTSVTGLTGTDLVTEILRRDPHKELIATSGDHEYISGR